MVRVDGRPAALRPRERDVLAAIALDHDRPVPISTVIDRLWPHDPPATARASVQNHVARVRRALGPDSVVTVVDGYGLGPGWALDVAEADALWDRARRRTAAGDHAAARVALTRAVDLHRGELAADLDGAGDVAALRAQRSERLQVVEDDLLLALVADGDHQAAVAQATALARAAPFREARWVALAVALHRAGRRREALGAVAEGLAALRERSGLDGGPHLRAVEAHLLGDDPGLMAGPVPALPDDGPPRRAAEHPFVGRRPELERVRRLLIDAFDAARGCAISIEGPSGMGTTAFAEQVAAQAEIDGWRVVATTCPSRASRALEPMGDVLHLLDAGPVVAPPVDEELRSGLDSPAEPGDGSGGGVDLADAVVDAVVAHASRLPTLVVVDDAHHLGPTSAGVLGRLARQDVALAVVVVGTGDGAEAARPDERTHVVALPPLTPSETARLLRGLGGEPLTQDRLRRIHASTGGAPGPTIRAIRSEDDDRAGSGTDDRVQAVVGALAVAGTALAVDVLASWTGIPADQVPSAVDAAVDAGVVGWASDGRAVLTSAAVGRRALAELTEDQQADARERLGLALLGVGDALAAAPHLLDVADRDLDRAVDTSEAAARAAAAVSMPAEAALLLARAATLREERYGADDERALRLRIAQAGALRTAGDPACLETAWAAVERAEAVGDGELFAHGVMELCAAGPALAAGTVDERLAEVAERAVAGCDDAATRARCATHVSQMFSMTGRIDRCRAHFERAEEAAIRSGDDRVRADVAVAVYTALTAPDEVPRRLRFAADMLAVAERLDDDDLRYKALHLYFSNQVQTADPLLRATFRRQQELLARLRGPVRRWMTAYQQACVSFLDGDLEGSLARSEASAHDPPVAASRALATHAMHTLVVRLAQGREQELVDLVDAVVASQPGLPAWRAVAMWLAARRGDDDRVREECDRLDCGRALPRDMPWGPAVLWIGRSVARLGDPDRAATVARLLQVGRGQMSWYGGGTVGPFDLALAELAECRGDRAAARAHLDAAQRCVDRIQAVVFQPDLDAVAARLARGSRATTVVPAAEGLDPDAT